MECIPKVNVEETLVIVNVVLKQAALKQQYLSDVQELVFRQTWLGQSYTEIAQGSDYDTDYIKNVGSKLWRLLSKALGEEVTKSNIHSVLKRYSDSVRASEAQLQELVLASSSGTTVNKHQDWGEAIDVSVFYGRTEELTTLQRWVIQDRCRLVALLGMGGIGKTALSVKLAEQIQGEFDALIWQSLRNAPPIQEMLINLLKFLSYEQETNFPETVDGKISRLIEYLRSSRCLLILDNFDVLFKSGERVGKYREGYEGYSELLQRVGEVHHQSCLVLTSREKPPEVAASESETTPVQVLQLTGLKLAAAQNLLNTKGLLGTENKIEKLIECYGGNPLALKIAATSIRDLFLGDICQFLQQGITAFNGVSNLLATQLQRLSEQETQVMYWLAINREPVSSCS